MVGARAVVRARARARAGAGARPRILNPDGDHGCWYRLPRQTFGGNHYDVMSN